MSREEFRHEELAYEEWVGHWEPEPEPKPERKPIFTGIQGRYGQHEFYRLRQRGHGAKRYAEHHLDPTVKRVVWTCHHGDAKAVEFMGKIVLAEKVDGRWKFFPEETLSTECTRARPIRVLGKE